MFADVYGQAAEVDRGIEFDETAIDCLRDLGMKAMADAGVPQKLIARYFGCTDRTVRSRLKSIPEEARRYYGRTLGRVGDAIRAAGA